ncbi:FAD-binding oxidoreductase [Arthrobacter jiangjiafuii]|uniref:FAD-binding oxidoreductase n=1 Tax=Arthrobacter jiangjiafuii TaxID=2817475 RepID=A0A975M7Y0_9MICC|nr:FAD-binding oxidoreductase [Arthrobacter jiangjiafuii]QWC11626.1 FAD-binding oxidoreductase [Arthrobacter jiangjiafuii]
MAVQGAGILGVSTAVALLRGGARVTLVTEGHPASGASGRSLSWLNSGGSYPLGYHHLRLAGMDRYRTLLAGQPGIDWLKFDGGVYWEDDDGAGVSGIVSVPGATDDDGTGAPGTTVLALAERYETQWDRAYEAHLVSAADLTRLLPGLDPAALPSTVLFNPGEGWVSLPHLIRHLLHDFALGGGTLVTAAGRTSVVTNAGTAVGLRTEDGQLYPADAVVVAAGAGTPGILSGLGLELPDRSELAMLVVTEPRAHGLRAVLNTPRVSVRPHPGSRLVMDHTWYLDQIVQAEDGGWAVDPQVAQDLADEASALLAGHPRLVPQSWRIGLKPIPGDGLPVLGELEAVPGCYTAFTHSGATLGLIAGELLAGEILTGRRHPMLAPFRPERLVRSVGPVSAG